jgi:hypothetical protein
MWWLSQTSGTHIRESWRFKSMYILHGKTWSIRHILSMLDSRRVTYRTTHVVYIGNLSLVPKRSKQTPTPRRSLGNKKHIDPTVVLGCLIPPPFQQPWSRGEVLIKWLHNYIGLLGSYTSMRSVRSILAHGDNPSVINWHRRRLQPCRVGFTHHTPQLFQPMISAFHLRAPPGLQFNQVLPINPRFKFKECMTTMWFFDYSATYRDLNL